MPKKNHSTKRHRKSQRGGDLFGSSSTSTTTPQVQPTSSSSSSSSSGSWFSGIGNKAKGLSNSISSWFSSSSPSKSVSGYNSPQTQSTYKAMGGKRRRHTRKLGRHSKSKKRR